MAKEKKRGFFSWFGLGREDESTPAPEEQQQASTVETETSHKPETDTKAAQKPLEQQFAEVPDNAPSDSENTPLLSAEPELSAEDQAETNERCSYQQPLPDVAEIAPSPASSETLSPPHSLVEATPTPQEAQPEQNLSPALEPEAVNLSTIEEESSLKTKNSLEEDPDLATVISHAQEQEKPTKERFFARLKRSLVKTRQNLSGGFVRLFRGKKIDDDLFEELEEQLLIADVGVATTTKIISTLTTHASREQLKDAEALYDLLKSEMADILHKVEQPLDIEGKTPFVILMVGVNGVGKTTTIGKLAKQYQSEGKSVMLAAGDTFRAAAVEQLQVWGQRNNIPVVAQHTGADSASVIFDAIQAAKSRGIDILIADTAGRLQNKSHLMEELKKITRVMGRLDEDAPHEVMLTLDASTGQNAISQAKLFNETVGLTGITLTKLDGTAKGGVIFSIADQFGIPIRYIGVGEGIDDLRPFQARDFIEALFARED